MVAKKFFVVSEKLAEERSIKIEDVFEIFKKALENSYKKEYGNTSCRIEIKPEKSAIFVYSVRKVVEAFTTEDELAVEDEAKDVKDDIAEILLDDAKKIKSSAKVGDVIEWQVNLKEFGRTSILASKSITNQGVRTKQRELAYEYFKPLENEMVMAKIVNENDKYIILDLGHGGTATLPKTELANGEACENGRTISVYIKSVEQTNKDPKIQVSRSDKQLVIRLMEKYIPEIAEGIIEIKGIARDAGDRSKIAIYSNDNNVDAIGSCVGEGGSRIREVVNALGGEKIDLYKWSENPEELITNSLQPANVTKVLSIDPKTKSSVVVVPDAHLSLAIGKSGQNVRLAVQSCGYKIDIIPVSVAYERGDLI